MPKMNTCHYDPDCTRADCHFAHPKRDQNNSKDKSKPQNKHNTNTTLSASWEKGWWSSQHKYNETAQHGFGCVMTDETQNHIKDVFQKIDKDKSGFIDIEDFKELLHNAPHQSRVQDHFRQFCESFDRDHDAKVSPSEFVQGKVFVALHLARPN
jgi:hypothetical protein